jgi:hypothetical protein
MKHVGFHGGSSIRELGSASDMLCFFLVLSNIAGLSEEDLLLLDRLIRKYLRMEELASASVMMSSAKRALSATPIDMDVLKDLGWTEENEYLNAKGDNLAEMFIKYFMAFEHCVESARGFFDDWGTYQPVQAIISDMPKYWDDAMRPLEEYDSLGPSDPPFWLR